MAQAREDQHATTCQLFAKFLEKLQATPDGDGSLLDHSLIVYGSGMSNGNVHAPDPLPLVVVGRRAGQGPPAHADSPSRRRSATCWLSVARQFGVARSTGSATAPARVGLF